MKLSELEVGNLYRMASGRDCVVVQIGFSGDPGTKEGFAGKVLIRTGDGKERWCGPSAIKKPIR